MFISLPNLHLAFTDFVLLAILLAIMYGVTLLEAVGTSNGREAAGISLEQRKRAATWAFVGIVVTLLAGVAASAEADSRRGSVYLIVPLVFIAQWAYFHWSSSKLIDVQLVLKHFDDAYRRAILKTLEDNPQGLSIEEVRQQTLESDIYLQILKVSSPLVKGAAPVPIAKMLETLLPTEEKTDAVLEALIQAGEVHRQGDDFYRTPGIAGSPGH